MKQKILIISSLCLILCLGLSSCLTNATAQKMAGEICNIMNRYSEEDLTTEMEIEITQQLVEVAKKPEYSKVTPFQLKRAMIKKCPKNWERYKRLTAE